jgi:CubicO group peptidase (beta-lactamase class C family)
LPRFLPDRPDIFNQPPDSIPFALARLHAGYTKKDFLRDLHHVQPDTLPGTRYSYSNVGAQLMAIILEQLYNKSFAALADSLILRPNGMRHLLADNSDDNPVQGYNAKSQPMPLMPPLMLAAGGIRSTVRDMLGYLRYQLNDADPVIVQAHTPVWEGTEGQALGFFWRITALPGGGKKIWHTGGTFGFSSYCVLYPEKKTGIVLLSNEMDGTSQGRLIDIAEQIVTELD